MANVRDLLISQGHDLNRGKLPGITDNELLYADGTACFSTKADLTEATLHSIETVSQQYGLKLDQGKCELL
eukprot:12891707-Prorocentrum_lima.AAC.1